MLNSENFQDCSLPNAEYRYGIRAILGHKKKKNNYVYKCTIFSLRAPVDLFMPFLDYTVILFL